MYCFLSLTTNYLSKPVRPVLSLVSEDITSEKDAKTGYKARPRTWRKAVEREGIEPSSRITVLLDTLTKTMFLKNVWRFAPLLRPACAERREFLVKNNPVGS